MPATIGDSAWTALPPSNRLFSAGTTFSHFPPRTKRHKPALHPPSLPALSRTRSHNVLLFDQDPYCHDKLALSLRTEHAVNVANSSRLVLSLSSASRLGPAITDHLETFSSAFLLVFSPWANAKPTSSSIFSPTLPFSISYFKSASPPQNSASFSTHLCSSSQSAPPASSNLSSQTHSRASFLRSSLKTQQMLSSRSSPSLT